MSKTLRQAQLDNLAADLDVLSGLRSVNRAPAWQEGAQTAAVQIIEHTAPPAQTSTERITAAIDRIRASRPQLNGGDEPPAD